MAVSAEGRVAVVAAGASVVFETSLDAVQTMDGLPDCGAVREGDRIASVGYPVAVAYGVAGELLVQGRDGVLTILPPGGVAATVRLSEYRVLDAGHVLFHHAPSPSAPVACASCHPEGRDDGHVWNFQALGPRRTQTMLGGVLDTAPLHWEGDMDGLDSLMGEVFVSRMGGAMPDEVTLEALGDWMQTLPALPPSAPRDAASAARGEQIFLDPEVKCADCHSGPALTNNTTVDVGTGRPFQVPTLAGIATRAPFMHDGCAPTLRDRFDPACGGGDAHGHTSQLTAEEIDDLVAYLETL
jgi:mono/diheme cytochrome c family protein